MRKVMLLVAVLGAASIGRAAENTCGCFTPTQEQIAGLEARITDLPEPIYHYARYYSGRSVPLATSKGQTVVQSRIQAQFLPLKPGEASAIHVVEARLPLLKGEGCIANLAVPPTDDAFEIYARCNRVGAWTPNAAEIAELERRLALPQGAAPLGRYARHYAGIADSGVRLIRGVFVDFAGATTPGIVVESEVELPLIAEDGCSAIVVEYNSETKLGSARCSGSN